MGGNFFKSIFVIALLLGVFACKTPDEKIFMSEPFETLYTKIYRGDSNILYEYQHVCGEGKTERLPVKIDLYDADSILALPLNLSKDTCKFCFIRKDMSIDTIEVIYKRTFKISHSVYYCETSDMILNHSSKFIDKDFSKTLIMPTGELTLKLIRKQ